MKERIEELETEFHSTKMDLEKSNEDIIRLQDQLTILQTMKLIRNDELEVLILLR